MRVDPVPEEYYSERSGTGFLYGNYAATSYYLFGIAVLRVVTKKGYRY